MSSWTLQKKHSSFEHIFFPLTQLFSLRVGCLVGCRVGCCVVVMLLSLSSSTLLPRCQHRHHCHRWHAARRRHRRCLARKTMFATQTPTTAPPRWCKLSAGHWNSARHWTGPFQPVARAANAARMMAAPTVTAKVGSRTGLVWSSPPPAEAMQRRQGWRASEVRGNKEGNCKGGKGGKR